MPLPGRVVILALLAGCSPGKFVWTDDGTPELAAYRRSFAADAGDRFTGEWPRERLLQDLAGVRVLWLGDHHKSPRLHTLHLELLEQLQRAGRPLALALEAVGTQDEDDVHELVAGTLSLDGLRTRMLERWPGSWLDDGDLDAGYYRAVLAFARRNAVPVRGLEPTPRLPLHARDHAITAAVRSLAATEPQRLVVVIVGQTHLLGDGDVVARTGGPSIALGGEPPPPLLANAPDTLAPGSFHRSTGGLWWFAELLRQ